MHWLVQPAATTSTQWGAGRTGAAALLSSRCSRRAPRGGRCWRRCCRHGGCTGQPCSTGISTCLEAHLMTRLTSNMPSDTASSPTHGSASRTCLLPPPHPPPPPVATPSDSVTAAPRKFLTSPSSSPPSTTGTTGALPSSLAGLLHPSFLRTCRVRAKGGACAYRSMLVVVHIPPCSYLSVPDLQSDVGEAMKAFCSLPLKRDCCTGGNIYVLLWGKGVFHFDHRAPDGGAHRATCRSPPDCRAPTRELSPTLNSQPYAHFSPLSTLYFTLAHFTPLCLRVADCRHTFQGCWQRFERAGAHGREATRAPSLVSHTSSRSEKPRQTDRQRDKRQSMMRAHTRKRPENRCASGILEGGARVPVGLGWKGGRDGGGQGGGS